MKPHGMSVEVERGGEGGPTLFAGILWWPVAEHVLAEGAAVLELLVTGA
jgi:hypothetical protein